MPEIKLSEKCSRCPREELVTVSLDEAVARVKSTAPRSKALTIVIDGKEAISYDTLCEECRGIVASYCEGAKRQAKRSSRRFKRVTATETPRVRQREMGTKLRNSS